MLDRIRHRLRQARARRLFGRNVHVFGPFTVVHPKNVRLGDDCALNHGVFLLGQVGIEIGDRVVLSARCMLIDGSLDSKTFVDADSRAYANAPIRIGDGAWIGAGAIILPGVSVGELAVVGAGSVVTRDVPARTVVAGNPARIIRQAGEPVQP